MSTASIAVITRAYRLTTNVEQRGRWFAERYVAYYNIDLEQ